MSDQMLEDAPKSELVLRRRLEVVQPCRKRKPDVSKPLQHVPLGILVTDPNDIVVGDGVLDGDGDTLGSVLLDFCATMPILARDGPNDRNAPVQSRK